MSTTSIATIIDSQEGQFKAVYCGVPGIEFEREKGFAMQILNNNEYTARIALANQQSLCNAITNIAAIGISLNPASKLAYLVPRDGKVCLDISYMGLMHIAQQCGAIEWGQSIIVRDNDDFELQEIGKMPIHKYDPFSTKRGNIVGCYCVVKTGSGDYLTTAMNIAQIYDIRNRSEAWKRGQKGPWKTDEEEMIKKTVVKNAYKYWPRRDRLDAAIHHLNTDGGEGFTPLNGKNEEPKDITPASADQQIAITDRLRELGKAFSDLNPFFVRKFKQEFESVGDLTAQQATAVLAFIQTRA